ncbi:MAG: TatD family hydrolase [Gammaproteobacteria bacterium]|nr:TatD family hydrolase [Gammaproteobacteria bacterium]MDH5515447.1 TatD family hydrolase [Gammaproteobacteria bacterium]
MLVDSHCHLDMLDLGPFGGTIDGVLEAAAANDVGHFLCVSINMEDYPQMLGIAESHDQVTASVGLHPNEQGGHDPSIDELVELAKHPKVVAIGETGLDYFRSEGDLDWQRERFRRHIRAARTCGKPVIVHSRDAREDTIAILDEEGASEVGGVMHCFTGDWAMAQQAMALNFHISFSGIVTFRSAKELQEVAEKIPAERMLVETDCPYLAPVPHRGKPNQPAFVKHTAEFIATLRGESYDQVACATTENFRTLFRPPVLM